MKEVTTIRIDPEKKKQIEELGLSLSSIVQDAIDKALDAKRCPTCNQKVDATSIIKKPRKDKGIKRGSWDEYRKTKI